MKRWITLAAATLTLGGCAAQPPLSPAADRASVAGTVAVTEQIAAPPDQVWRFVGDFPGVTRWNPLLLDCKVTKVDGHVFRTAYLDGWWIKERLDRRDARHHRLDYSVVDSSRPDIVGSKASIVLTRVRGHETRIEWIAVGPPRANPSPAADAMLSNYYRTRIGHLRSALTSAALLSSTH